MVLRAYQWFSGELLVVLSGCHVVVHNVFWWFSITTIVLLNGFKYSMVPNGYRWFSMVTSSSRWFSKCNVLLLVFNFAFHCRLSLLIEMVLCKFLCTCTMLLVNNIKPPNKMHYEIIYRPTASVSMRYITLN